jgi:putative glycosyltransferase (TIGR04372 family)
MGAIVMLLNSHALGELLIRSLYLAALSRHYPESRVFAVIDPATPDQAMSLLLNPRIDYFLVADKVSREFLADLPWTRVPGDWAVKRGDIAFPFLFVHPHWTRVGGDLLKAVAVHDFDPGTFVWRDMIDNTLFTVPPSVAEDCETQLCVLGLDRERWFMTLHIRQDGYRAESGSPRSIRSLAPYEKLVQHVFAQGGQVVRLGDPSMSALDAPGLIDLSRIPHSFLLQAYACSRSRFLFGGDSGPVALAAGFNTPAVMANIVNLPTWFTAPKNHIIATKKFRLENGTVVRDEEAAALGMTGETRWYGAMERLEELSGDELCTLCDLMLARTPPCGWVEREPAPSRLWRSDGTIDVCDVARRQPWDLVYFTAAVAENG